MRVVAQGENEGCGWEGRPIDDDAMLSGCAFDALGKRTTAARRARLVCARWQAAAALAARGGCRSWL